MKRKLNMTKEVRFLIIINSYKYLFYFDMKIGKTYFISILSLQSLQRQEKKLLISIRPNFYFREFLSKIIGSSDRRELNNKLMIKYQKFTIKETENHGIFTFEELN